MAGGGALGTAAPPAPIASATESSPTSLHRFGLVLGPCGLHAGTLKQA